MIDITTLRAMAKAGASVDVILAAIEAELVAEGARVQARRAKDAERQRRSRHADSKTVTPCHAESHPVTRSHSDMELSLTSSSFLTSTKEASKKEESKKERASKRQLPSDWVPKPAHYAKAKKLNHPDGYVDQKAEDLRDWARSKAIMRADWDATFNGFLKNRETTNGFGGPRPLQDDSKSISRAGRELTEKARRGEFTFGPRPSILPRTGDDDVLLLSKGRGT